MANPGDIFQAAQRFTMPEGVEAYNVYAFELTDGSATDAEILTAIGAKMLAAYGDLQASIANVVDMQECKVTQVIWQVSEWIMFRLVGSILNPVTFTNVNDMLPHAVAAPVTFNTTRPRTAGRKFIPGLSEVDQDESILSAGVLTNLANYAAEIVAPQLAGSAANLRYRILTSSGDAIAQSAYTINDVVGSQRRRKPGVGV